MEMWIKDYVGIEFENKGRGEKVDCWGLAYRIFQEKFNIEIPSFDEYESAHNIQEIGKLIKSKETISLIWKEIEKGKEQFGDIAIFLMQGSPVHIGIVIGDKKMLHIEKGVNSCIEKYNTSRYVKRLYKFYRHRGMG